MKTTLEPPPDSASGPRWAGAADARRRADLEREVETLTVLDSLQMHIALLDPQGTIVAINRAWQLFGLANGASAEQANSVGTSYLDTCGRSCRQTHCLQAAQARDGIAAVLSGAEPVFEFEYPCDAPHEQRWFQMRVTPLHGPRGGAVVTHEDITKRWRLEQQRAELIAGLMSANRELSDFAYVVSHDLKAPLRGISSLTSWLVSDYADKLGSEGCEHVTMIASRVRRLSSLIDAILAYSRAGRSHEELAPVPLTPLVRNVIDLLSPPPHIRVEITCELPELVIDAVKIQQVFQNLLSNAIDFMDKAAGRVTVACVLEGPLWRFTVADNGPGIEARHFDRIFHLFQTLASRDEFERTGVGLALVKKIVELAGGTVWVESVVGTGTSFHFTIPSQPAPAAAGL
jgi:signal transduction histidine kinase